MRFIELQYEDTHGISTMSQMATSIVREHFDPLIGKEQNDYMIARFQTESAIKGQMEHGCRYFFVQKDGRNIGFMAFYPKESVMYLSKFYLYKKERGKGYAHQMLDFVIDESARTGMNAIELNVNKHNSACQVYDRLGFRIIRSEKNDIGNGFFMDDYVYRFDIQNSV